MKLVLVIVLISTVAFGNFFQRSDEYLRRQNELKSALEFSLTFEEAKKIIMKHYPELKTDAEVREFIVERDIQRTIVDGIEMYYIDLEHNLFTR
ncbi:MAG: Transglutaminase-like enzyme, predicted cysteine protease, partial [Mesotoga prima]